MTKHLYIHIPFCDHICSFCDFKRIKTNEYTIMSSYVNKVIEEIKTNSSFNQYETIYLGGGTPNHLPNDLLEQLLGHLKNYLANDYEFTIECNPNLITKTQVKIFANYGVNRISLGVQSTNDEILAQVGRKHRIADAKTAVTLLKENNITNISCDFIYDLPKTSNEDLVDAINFIEKHEINHVSFYALEMKENSILNKQNYQLDLQNQEDKMVFLQNLLKKHNYKRYEISNWVKNHNNMSKHNLAYWYSYDWKAIGYGACGFENRVSYKVLGTISDFNITESEVLNDADYYFQILMMGLRLVDGLDLSNELYNKAYQFYQDKLTDCQIINNHLRANNIDLLNDLLIKLLL